jgi:zinc resistance-associated protein
MWKPLVVLAGALVIGGLSVVYAQQRYGTDDDGTVRWHQRDRMSAEDRAAFVDARIAALKAGLELTPDQAKNWPAFEQASRDMAQVRVQIRAAREAGERSPTPTTPFERMTRRADNMTKISAALKHIADTGTPLYQSLDDAQKGRFEKLAHMLRPHRHHMHDWNERG